MVLIKEAYNINNELELEVCSTFLYNLYKEKIDKGLANITFEDNVLYYREIEK